MRGTLYVANPRHFKKDLHLQYPARAGKLRYIKIGEHATAASIIPSLILCQNNALVYIMFM